MKVIIYIARHCKTLPIVIRAESELFASRASDAAVGPRYNVGGHLLVCNFQKPDTDRSDYGILGIMMYRKLGPTRHANSHT